MSDTSFHADSKVEVVAETQFGSESSDVDYKAEKALLWKLDWRILPVLAPLYVCSFLDRVNIGNARLYGLEDDLGLSSMQFSIALSILFVTYVSVEVPSNLLIKRIGPSRWIFFITFMWGVVALCTGFVQSFAGLVVCRLFLGLFEGGFVPGVLLYLSDFYTKNEIATRVSLFLIASPIAGAFGGLLAYAIGHMDGILGHRGWRWILILEGIPTSLLALLSFFYLADSPETAKYLTPEEKMLLRARQQRCIGGSGNAHVLQKKDVYEALKDWRIWLLCVIGFSSASMLYGYSTFLPTIIHGIDPTYSVPMVQVMTIPCYLSGAFVMLLAAYISDRLQTRGSIGAAALLFSLAGYSILLASKDSGAGYAGCMLIALGMYPCMTLSIAWLIANCPRYGKRSMGIAMSVMSVNSGGIMMSYIYPKSEGPRYKRGHTVTLSLACVAWAGLAFLSAYYARENRRRRAGLEDHKIADMTLEEIEELGDRSPRFMYTT